MNAIDDIGQKVGVSRGRIVDEICGSDEGDQKYALRILEKLYRTYQAVNAEGWRGDQETNEYSLQTENGIACIARDARNKVWIYYAAKGYGKPFIEGTARYLEKAMQICSLALSP